MAARVEATTRELSQSGALISPDKSSVSASAPSGDKRKPALGPKPSLMPKPFALQKNVTIRPIKAPKTVIGRLPRPASSDNLDSLSYTKPSDSRVGDLKTPGSLKPDSNSTPNGSNNSTGPKPVPLGSKPDFLDKPKPAPTRNADITGSDHRTGPDIKHDVTATLAEDLKEVQPRIRAKSLGAQDQRVFNKKPEGETTTSKTDAGVSLPTWPHRNRLSMELTSRFESPSQLEKEVDSARRDNDKMRPPNSPSAESKLKSTKPLVETGEMGGMEVSGSSIKRRISLLFDRPTASQHRDSFIKRDATPSEISVDIKQRIKNLSLNSAEPKVCLPSTGALKSPPIEKTPSNSDESSFDERAPTESELQNGSHQPKGQQAAEKPPSTTDVQPVGRVERKNGKLDKVFEIKPDVKEKAKEAPTSKFGFEKNLLVEDKNSINKEEDEVEEDKENYVPVPLYRRVGTGKEAETKREEEERQKKEEQLETEIKQLERERLLEEERKSSQEIERLQEEKQKHAEEERCLEEERRKQERKQAEERQRQMEERRKKDERNQAEKEKERQQEQERLQKDRQLEEERRKIEEERERERQKEKERLRLEKEREIEEEKRRIEEERLRQEREKERLRKEKDMEERRRIEEEERLIQEREKERLRKEREMEEERRCIQETERQKEEERLRQEREKERLRKEREMEERKQVEEEERLRQDREKERLRKEKDMEERRRIEEEERLIQEREKERLKKEKEIEEERRQIQEMERLKEEERLRQEREKERLRKEREMEEERRRIQEIERQKEEERLRQEREKERLRKEREMEERKQVEEEERLRQDREKERLRKEKDMEERRRIEEEERLIQEREKERLKKEKEIEEERRQIQEMERLKEEERLRQERENERLRKQREMEEERRRIQEIERQKEEERLRQEREKERLRKEREMEERKQVKEEERLRQEREKERLKKEKEMEEERRRIQEMERQKEEERLRQERDKERLRKEREVEEESRWIQEMERQKEEERLRQERDKERLRKEREMEEERRQIEEIERHKEEERLRQTREIERLRKGREMEEERRRIQEMERLKEEERLRQERENERLKKEREMEQFKEVERLREEVPTSYDLISFDLEEPALSQSRVSNIQATNILPQIPEVLYDDFSVKPRRWGTKARRSSTPSPSREPPAVDVIPEQLDPKPESRSNDPGSQGLDQVYMDDLIGFEPATSNLQNSSSKHPESRNQLQTVESKPEHWSKPETESSAPRRDEVTSHEGQLKDSVLEEDGVALHDAYFLIKESDSPDKSNTTVDNVDGESRIFQALNRVKRQNVLTDSDKTNAPGQEEPELLPFPESSAPLLDSSVFRSKVDLAKKRSIKRTRPSRSVRQRAALPSLTEGTHPNWRFCDSTDAAAQCSNEGDSDSEEEPSKDSTSSPAPSQPKRVPLFPGMDQSALMAQLKRRSGVIEADTPSEGPTTPSVPTRLPRVPAKSLGPRVLPPVDAKDSGSGSSPSWLLELKSKKRTSQPESEV
ncbi:182 kDa tankyrase-1-binding protein isoform X2 [Myxocyprinus asiaticus]|nr:182 kDa tankyrase-1-binding protein isoform X2 [Myxocyprinus asiaticus]